MVRFGVIGTNWISEHFIQAARDIDEFSLTAVYSRTKQRAMEFGALNNIPHTFTDVKELAKSNVIDAVYIASPNSFHMNHALQCMEQGKHVLCEKPLASNTLEVKQMIKSAQDNGVMLMEAVKSSFLPSFQAIQENLHKIGKVRRIVANYCQYSSRYDAYKQGHILNAFNPEFSNGSLMDIGIYCIYPTVILFGKPESIQASSVMLDSGVDGSGSILLKYEEMDAVIMYSKISDSYLPSEIQGENGCIIIDKINQPRKVEIRYRDGRIEDISQPQVDKSMYYEVKAFINLVKKGQLESSLNSHQRSITVMEIMDEVRTQIGLVYPADK
ncbi:Gfo/Idh/MocA family protein [Ammoniphilus sp. CFH 90114]|uniref:Gfo/Idh/MocA family protein n=1 Tax=Ammoniphilus sp. CFH 90114 TaxID=2493665 RepID=UPI00100F3AFB|nr:Gfo/Idh/MocA family oxidoreductase [Ammoniphilus sp. CFH 90114]RXT06426.1 Gfo/Idh/MocA family oxidoreductase [Ammoniphilus sp. CFH 90114]